MTSRQHLEAELEQIKKKSGWISFVVWAVAVLVMVFGIPIVYELLTAHDVPGQIAWLLSIASDGALVVGLVATPVLATYGLPAGWIGTLRWIAGFITWGLQTLSPFTQKPGPDWIGVVTHSAGPVLLFFVVEGASYFQRRMGEVITEKRRELEVLERADRDEKNSIAALRQRLNDLTLDNSKHLRETERLTSEVTSARDLHASETAALRASVEALEAERDHLREDVERRLEAASAEHAEVLRKLKQQHSEKLAAVRAEASTINLEERRNRGSKTTSGAASKSAPTPRLSDEDAVQKLLDHDKDLTREWTQSDIVRVAGVGWSRAPRLLEAVSEEQTRRASEGTSGDQAVNQ